MKWKTKKISHHILASLEDSKILAGHIASFGSRVICLNGNLGAGKTTLAGMIIRELTNDHTLNIKSPTFNIVQIYDYLKKDAQSDFLAIYHYDLYRLNNLDEALEIGIEESFDNGISIIEWPEIIFPILPKSGVIFINIESNADLRIASISHYSSEAQSL